MKWRLLFLVVFLPCALPFGLCSAIQMIVAGFLWIVCGPDAERTDRIITGPPASVFIAPLDYLLDQKITPRSP